MTIAEIIAGVETALSIWERWKVWRAKRREQKHVADIAKIRSMVERKKLRLPPPLRMP